MPKIQDINVIQEQTQFGVKDVFEVLTDEGKEFYSYAGKWNNHWTIGTEITASPDQWKQKGNRYFLMAPPEARPQQAGQGGFKPQYNSMGGRPTVGEKSFVPKPGQMDFKAEITNLKSQIMLINGVLKSLGYNLQTGKLEEDIPSVHIED